jgi:histone deacetylase 11
MKFTSLIAITKVINQSLTLDAYPGDYHAKKGINMDVPITSLWDDKRYLDTLKTSLKDSFSQFMPDIVYYNAGSDILDSDPLGGLSISAEGITARDEMVFEMCIKNNVPIVMVLSGGYSKENARVITNSIENMMTKLDLKKIAENAFEKNLKK